MGVGYVHHSTQESSLQVPGLSYSGSLPYDYNAKTHLLTAVLGLDVCFVSQAPVHGEENVMPAKAGIQQPWRSPPAYAGMTQPPRDPTDWQCIDEMDI
jgi:hypothetical protein